MSEQTTMMIKRTEYIMFGCIGVVVAVGVLYFTGILQLIIGPKNLGDLSYLEQSAATGMVAPVSNMVAYVDNGQRYATNTPEGKNLAAQNVSGKNVALGNNPVVLFNISSAQQEGKALYLPLYGLGLELLL